MAINQAFGKSLEDVLCVMLVRFQKEQNLYFSNNILVEAIKSITRQDFKLKIDDLIDGNINLSEILKNSLPKNVDQLEPTLYSIPQYIYNG